MTRDLILNEVPRIPRSIERETSGPPGLREWLSQFSLRPHGDQLLSPSARFWIFCARVLILIMATAEAVSWGYVGSLFGTGFASLLSGLAAAASLFFVIWLVDATFVTMDTSRAYYQRTLASDTPSDGVNDQRKFFAGLVIRGVIVMASLWITAPFMAQLVFRRDVADTIASRNDAAMSTARRELAGKYEQRLQPLDSALNEAQSAAVLEVSGQGGSGKYGRGAAAMVIEQQITDLQRRIGATAKERDSVLYAFDRARTSELASRFGVTILEDGLRARSEVLGVMLDNPDYSGARTALAVFLTFLFLGLVILKLFQPRSVSIYYSEHLQSLYTDYSQGKFDEHLDTHDRPRSGVPMTPQRFEEWCIQWYRVVREEDERRRRTEQVMHTHERKMRTWVDDLHLQENLLEERRMKYERISAEVLDIESRVQSLTIQAEAERRELDRSSKTLEAIAQHIAKGPVDVRGVERGFAAQAQVQAQIDELEEALRVREAQIGELSMRIPIRRDEAASLREDIAELDRAVREVYSRMTRERTHYHDWLGNQTTLRKQSGA